MRLLRLIVLKVYMTSEENNIFKTWPKQINIVVLNSVEPTNFPFVICNEYPQKKIEIERILKQKIKSVDLGLEEIQSKDPIKVVKHKAVEAWKKNDQNPIFVEDTSLCVMALDGLPGTYTRDFTQTVDQRRLICAIAKDRGDLRAIAKVFLAIYDGREVLSREGETQGKISSEPRGLNGFGWDDIFIPDGQLHNQNKTFAEMTGPQKDRYSMRRKAWENLSKNPVNLHRPVNQLAEPFTDEMERIRHEEFSPKAKKFAFKLESTEIENAFKKDLTISKYAPIVKQKSNFYSRYSAGVNSPSLGLILTNIDLNRVVRQSDGEPVLWQMGPERRRLALALRALYFDLNQNASVHRVMDNIEKKKIVVGPRSNVCLPAVEEALGLKSPGGDPMRTPALSELGYNKISSSHYISRREILRYGLFNKVGKYPRKIVGMGSMPPVSGWRDTVVMASLGHMLSFIPRNSLFAHDISRRVQLALEAKKVIVSCGLPEIWQQRAKRNIGASLGAENPKEELNTAKVLFKRAGIKLFRIYTIGADPRVVETARLLRQEFGDEIEIFVGQISDKKQGLLLIDPKVRVDGLIFGHGGGRQCTSAINGMAITTLEEVYSHVIDSRFNNTSLLVEGGVGRSVGSALVLGVDCVLYNQQFVHGTIEVGDLFVQDEKGRICQPYPGSASPVTQIIESEHPSLRARRTDAAGRTHHPEGKPGFMYYEEKANSMAFWVNEFLGHAARTLADLGVSDMGELRTMLQKEKRDFLRIMTDKTQYLSDAYGNGK